MARRPARGIGVRRKQGESVEQLRARVAAVRGPGILYKDSEITVTGDNPELEARLLDMNIRLAEDLIATNLRLIASYRAAQARLRGESIAEVVN